MAKPTRKPGIVQTPHEGVAQIAPGVGQFVSPRGGKSPFWWGESLHSPGGRLDGFCAGQSTTHRGRQGRLARRHTRWNSSTPSVSASCSAKAFPWSMIARRVSWLPFVPSLAAIRLRWVATVWSDTLSSLEPPPLFPARGPPADWGEFVQAHFRPGNHSGTDRRAARDRHPQPLTGSHATVRTAREKSGFKAGSSRRDKSGLERGQEAPRHLHHRAASSPIGSGCCSS